MFICMGALLRVWPYECKSTCMVICVCVWLSMWITAYMVACAHRVRIKSFHGSSISYLLKKKLNPTVCAHNHTIHKCSHPHKQPCTQMSTHMAMHAIIHAHKYAYKHVYSCVDGGVHESSYCAALASLTLDIKCINECQI